MPSDRALYYLQDVFSEYTLVGYEDGALFDIIHLIDTGEECGDDGYTDARFFKIYFYNRKNKTYFYARRRFDAVSLLGAKVSNVRIFLNGSTCITFHGLHVVSSLYQDIEIVLKGV